LRHNLALVAAVWREVGRIHDRGPLDVVCAPVWNCEGLACSFDQRFPTVLTLMTSFQTVLNIHPSHAGSDWARQLLPLEKLTLRSAKRVHGISADVLAKARRQAGELPGESFVLPLGVRDRTAEVSRRRPADGKVRVLFVGRLERRKGVDVLLEAAEKLTAERPEVEFVLVGKETPNTEQGATYRELFRRR